MKPNLSSNIDDMPAGREMDALVAEKVMGWTAPTQCSPPYSTDISAAWLVVEKLRKTHRLYHLSIEDDDATWFVSFVPAIKHVHGDTVPLAICRAALKAVESR